MNDIVFQRNDRSYILMRRKKIDWNSVCGCCLLMVVNRTGPTYSICFRVCLAWVRFIAQHGLKLSHAFLHFQNASQRKYYFVACGVVFALPFKLKMSVWMLCDCFSLFIEHEKNVDMCASLAELGCG